MNYNLSRRDASISAVFLSPFERLEQGSVWVRVLAAIGSVVQYVQSDAFAGALIFVVLIGIADYWIGVRAARANGNYDPAVAHRGALGKVSGVVLLLFIRAFEYYLHLHALIPDFHGMGATAIAISLFAVDLQSVAHHREELGAQKIPGFSQLIEWFQRIASSRIESASADTPAGRAEDPKP